LVSGVVKQGSARGGRARLRLERAQPLGGVRDLRALLAQLELQRVDLLVRYEAVGLHERRGGHESERDDRAERPRADGAAAARLALDDRRRRRTARAAEERDAHLAVAAERNALSAHRNACCRVSQIARRPPTRVPPAGSVSGILLGPPPGIRYPT
jgi:hypothetical protein